MKFVSFICYVLQFILIKGNFINHMQPQHLEMSLMNVNKLLANLDDEIAIERELLSQIDDTNSSTGGQTANPSRINEHQMPMHPRDMQMWTATKSKNIVPAVPELEREWPFNNGLQPIRPVWPVTITTLTTAVTYAVKSDVHLLKHPIRKSMLSFMKEEKVKYVCAFVKGLFESLVRKPDDDLKVMLEAFATTLLRMLDKNHLRCAGDVLQIRLRHLATLVSNLLPSNFKAMSNAILLALRHRLVTYPDGLDLLKTYDQLFSVDEGNNLLDVVIAADNYNVKTFGKPLAASLAGRCLQVFIAPIIRKCGSSEVQFFINKVNEAYVRRFISGRSMPEDMIYAFISKVLTDNLASRLDTPPNRRAMSKTHKHVKSEYKKMIKHYILKHPTLFKKIAKHYKQSEERKRRHSKRKNHRNLRHKRRRQKHKHHKKQSQKVTSKSVKNKPTTYMTKTGDDFQSISEIAQTTKLQKRFNLVDKANSRIKKNIPNVLFRRNQDGSFEKYKDKTPNISRGLSKESLSTKIFASNNTILKKIIGESSYSDEELFLKTMLKDAYFHGNYTPTATDSPEDTDLEIIT